MQLTGVLFIFGLVFVLGAKAQQQKLKEAASEVVEELLKNSENEKLSIDGNFRSSLEKALGNQKDKLKEVAELSGDSAKKLASDFGQAVAKDRRLQLALSGNNELAPRVLGSSLMGIMRLASDMSTTFFSRYPSGAP